MFSLSGFPEILFRMKLAVLPGLRLLLLKGLFIAGVGSWNVWRGIASSHWPEVRSTYAANIVFRYRVNGQEYSTGVIQFGEKPGSSDSSEAELRRMRYRAGSGFHSGSLWLPGAGLAIALAAMLFGMTALGSDGSFVGYGMAVFAMIFVLIGAPMLTAGPLNLWRAYASKQWPVATRVVLSGKQSSGNMEAAAGSRLVYR